MLASKKFRKEAGESAEKASKTLEEAGRVITVLEVGFTIELLKLQSEDTLLNYMELVDEDSGVYKGLKINYNDLKKADILLYAEKILDQEVLPEFLGLMVQVFTGTDTPAAALVAKVNILYKVAGFGMGLFGVIDMEDYLKVQYAMTDLMWLQSAWNNVRVKIYEHSQGKGNYTTKELKEDYQDTFELYISCLYTVRSYLDDYSDNKKYYKKLDKHLEEYKSELTYEKYIQSCLDTANEKYPYVVKDGKVILGTDSSANSSAAKNQDSILADKDASTMINFIADKLDFSINAFAAETGNNTEEDKSYRLNIPDEIDGCPVTEIGEGLFADDEDICAVYIPESVETIGKDAFKGCTNLKTVIIESGVSTIEEGAFNGCTSLEEVDIPDTVETIGENAFAESTAFTAKEDSSAQTYAKANGNTIEIRNKTVKEISVKQKPDKTSYTMSEELDLTGMILTVTYADGTTEDISDGYEGCFVEKQIGTNKAYVYYKDASTEIELTVIASECDYTVRYINELGEEIHDQVKGTAMAGTKITLDCPEIDGYTCDEQELTQEIGEYNSFVVTYTTKEKPDINDASVTYTKTFTETGKAITPPVEVRYNGTLLKEGTDYEVEYSENVEVGNGNIWIIGIGSYDGIQLCSFDIKAKDSTKPAADTTSSKPGTNKTGSKITALRLTGISKQIAAGRKIKLTAWYKPFNAAKPKLKWTSSNKKVATVTQNGVVTLKKKSGGKSVTITATALDGSGKKAVFKIKSMKGVVKKVTIKGKKSVKVRKKLKLKAKVKATKKANKKLLWKSSNTKYATVNAKGVVTAKKAGKGKKVKITAMATDGSGKKATIKIKIK